jgi:Ser/Thr protein kinase RdoA (MazF antagonist)
MLDDIGPLIDRPALDQLSNSIQRNLPLVIASRSQSGVVCHGDVHPGNVLQTADGPVLLDWDLLCHGPAGWDHGPMMTWTERWGGAPGIYEDFAEGYGESLRGQPLAEAIAELRLVAATLMRVRAGRADASAMPEAERRLRWWRGDPGAPTWQAQ